MSETDHDDVLLSTAEVAKLLGFSVSLITRLLRSDTIPTDCVVAKRPYGV